MELDRQSTAKRNLRFPNIDQLLDTELHCRELYEEVLKGIAKNVKMGPFTATSGIVLPYYLNASTNFLDKTISPKILQLFAKFLIHWLPRPKGETYLLCGMEMAGGILAAQLASAQTVLDEVADYIYIRKDKKTTGTAQQLEGPQIITSRTRSSPPIKGVWVDDAMSTGSSMKAGVELLRDDYNIVVTHALYLVDRTNDRADLPPERQHLADPIFDNIQLRAIFDLCQVDRHVHAHPGTGGECE
eukprot:NODE_4098_length_840_cov_103.096774_g3940_i0.p1 GENE.NODE_4098_length_840_cov_103.096774_g3940_i0~~NODE_4098_length_840_cov_103.096774_g3940_i0.p1  ORF type:complete len:244 (-),score=49.69 NODE_4098_length_840_cov_103.096774_g3940_i0:46-777(-)